MRLVRRKSKRADNLPESLRAHIISPEAFEAELAVYNRTSVFILSYNTALGIMTTKQPLEENVDDDGEGSLPQKPQPTTGSGEFVARKARYTVREPFMATFFSTILIDEAYICRNFKNIIPKLIQNLPSRSIVAATATPLQNKVKDVVGYLHLIWKGDDFPSDKDFLDLPSPEFRDRYPSYDCPCSIGQSIDYRNSQVIDWPKLWLLNPRLLERYGSMCHWDSRVSETLLPEVLREIQLRRTLLAPLRLPNGTLEWPADDIPPVSAVTEELHFPNHWEERVVALTNKLIPRFRKEARKTTTRRNPNVGTRRT